MIRRATRYDIPRLMEFVEAYAYANPIHALGKPQFHEPKHVEQLLFQIIMGKGFALIDNQMRGTLIAVKQQNIWCPQIKELHELLWWVEPENRGTVGGRLWLEFDDIARQMLQDGEIQIAYSSVSANGPLIDYTKRGYKAMGATFFRE